MNISEAARATGLSSKQIRDYEKIGLIRPSHRTEANYRTYAEADIQRLSFIRHAREVGFSLAQIGELLAFRDAPSHNCEEILRFTNTHIAELSEKIEALQTMKDKLLELQKTSCLSDGNSGCAIKSFEVVYGG